MPSEIHRVHAVLSCLGIGLELVATIGAYLEEKQKHFATVVCLELVHCLRGEP